MPYEIRIEDSASQPLAVVRRQVAGWELATVVPECCGLVWQAVKAQKARAGRHVAVYLDDSIRVEVGVELLDHVFLDDGEVVRSVTPAGTVACTTHLGPYSLLAEAHEAIHDWCAEQGHELAGPRWEIYGHWRPEWDADPSQIRTDVHYLIASR
jgi:effector-binding domain-containing protein